MTGRGAAVQVALAVVGLGAAYATWRADSQVTSGRVPILELARNDLVKIRVESDGLWTEAERKDGPAGLWLRLGPRAEAPERVVRGSGGVARLFETLAPFVGTRALEDAAGTRAAEMGLDPAARRLLLGTPRAEHRFVLGSPADRPQDVYVRSEKSGRIFVIDPELGKDLLDLAKAEPRFIEQMLHAYALRDVEIVTISARGRKREMKVLPDPKDIGASLLAPVSRLDAPDEAASAFAMETTRLFAIDVFGRGEVIPGGPAPSVALRTDDARAGKSLGWTEYATRSVAPDGPREIFVRTEFTAGWIRTKLSDEDLAAAEKLVLGD